MEDTTTPVTSTDEVVTDAPATEGASTPEVAPEAAPETPVEETPAV